MSNIFIVLLGWMYVDYTISMRLCESALLKPLIRSCACHLICWPLAQRILPCWLTAHELRTKSDTLIKVGLAVAALNRGYWSDNFSIFRTYMRHRNIGGGCLEGEAEKGRWTVFNGINNCARYFRLLIQNRQFACLHRSHFLFCLFTYRFFGLLDWIGTPVDGRWGAALLAKKRIWKFSSYECRPLGCTKIRKIESSLGFSIVSLCVLIQVPGRNLESIMSNIGSVRFWNMMC